MTTKVKPSRINITGTPTAGKIPAYVSPDEMEWIDNPGGGGWGTRSSHFFEYELWEDIPAGLHAVSELSWDVDYWFNAIPALSIASQDPAGEDIGWINYKVTTTLINLLQEPFRVFDQTSTWIATNTVQEWYVTLEMSEPIKFNKSRLTANHWWWLRIEYSLNWTDWVEFNNWGWSYFTATSYWEEPDTITSRFIRLWLRRTSWASFSVSGLQFNNITQYPTGKLYIAESDNIDRLQKVYWFVEWPKSAGEIVDVAHLEWTIIQNIPWLVDWKDYLLWDNWEINLTWWTNKKVRIWLSDNWLLIFWDKRFSTKTQTASFSKAFWNQYFVMPVKWNLSMYWLYSSSIAYKYAHFDVYFTWDKNYDITWITPTRINAYNSYSNSWPYESGSTTFNNIPDCRMVVKATFSDVESWPYSWTIYITL